MKCLVNFPRNIHEEPTVTPEILKETSYVCSYMYTYI